MGWTMMLSGHHEPIILMLATSIILEIQAGEIPGPRSDIWRVVLYSWTDHCNRFISDDTEYRFWAKEVL